MVDGLSRPRLLIVATSEITLRSFLLPYAEHFRSIGWTVDGMARGASMCPKCAESFDHVWDASWRRSPMSMENARAFREIRRVARADSYDIVHVHTPVAGIVTRLAVGLMMPRTRPSLVYTAHGFHFHPHGAFVRNVTFGALEKAVGRWTDRLVVINSDDRRAATKYRLVPVERLRAIPGIGVDANEWRRDLVPSDAVRAVRERLRLPENDSLLLAVAELNPGKRHSDVLEAIATLDRSDIQLAIAGEGPDEEAIRRLAVALGIDDRVHLLGFRDDIPALMCASTAVVHVSEREGLPRAVMEAMSLGVPVIGSGIRGVRDLLGGGAGVLVELGDIRGLAAAIEAVADNEETRDKMVDCARSRIGNYSLAETIRLHESMYDELLGLSR